MPIAAIELCLNPAILAPCNFHPLPMTSSEKTDYTTL